MVRFAQPPYGTLDASERAPSTASKADMCGALAHVRSTPESGRNSGHRMSMKGRARLLCPASSNVDLLGYGEGIVHIYAEIPDGTLYLGVTEQNLNRSQIPSAAVNQRCLGPPQ